MKPSSTKTSIEPCGGFKSGPKILWYFFLYDGEMISLIRWMWARLKDLFWQTEADVMVWLIVQADLKPSETAALLRAPKPEVPSEAGSPINFSTYEPDKMGPN